MRLFRRQRSHKMPKRPEEYGDRVRIGSDWNSHFHAAEVSRIDIDTDEGTFSVCVERLGSQGVIIVDIFKAEAPIFRERVADFKSTV